MGQGDMAPGHGQSNKDLPIECRIRVERSGSSAFGSDLWSLYVDGKAALLGESYAVCDQVRAALLGEAWPCGECHEVADVIRKTMT